MIRRRDDRRRDASFAESVQADVRCDERDLGAIADRRSVRHRERRPFRRERRRTGNDRRSADVGGVHAAATRELLAGRSVKCDSIGVQHLWRGEFVGRDRGVGVARVNHRAHLESARRDHDAVGQQCAHAISFAAREQHSRCGETRRARYEFDPPLVAFRRSDGGRTSRLIDAHPGEDALVPAVQSDDESRTRPHDTRQVFVHRGIPHDRCLSCVEGDDVRRHHRIVCSGTWIPHCSWWSLRVCGVCDPRRLDGGLIDSGNDESITIGRPPVAAMAPHLLSGDELCATPTHVATATRDDRRRTILLSNVQVVADDVGDPPPARTEAGVEDRRLEVAWRYIDHGRVHEVDDEQPSGHGECSLRDAVVARVGDDAGSSFARTFPPCALEFGIGARRVVHEFICVRDATLT